MEGLIFRGRLKDVIGSGDGDGYGSGYGYGDGSGYGYGDGYGDFAKAGAEIIP